MSNIIVENAQKSMPPAIVRKYFILLVLSMLLVACQTIPEWDKAMLDNPLDDGRCPDLSGRFNYEHLDAKHTGEFDSILRNNIPGNLPGDQPVPGLFDMGHYSSAAISNKIHKGKSAPYLGMIVVTLTRTDQMGRKYRVRVDWDAKGSLGEFDSTFDETWVCSSGNLFRSAKSTLHERSNRDEIDPRDYRRIYLLPNGDIRIDRKHTYIAGWNRSYFARYYESRVFAKIP